jgi:membrane-associated phospholipid phosphatase
MPREGLLFVALHKPPFDPRPDLQDRSMEDKGFAQALMRSFARAGEEGRSDVMSARLISLLLAVYSYGLVVGCGTLPNGRGWGQDATPWPGWQRVHTATVDAALAPETWAPVAGALVLHVGNMDKKFSRLASDHTPVFGSQKRADRASDLLRDSTNAAYWLTALATPSGETPKEWVVAKAKGAAVGVVAALQTSETTGLLTAETNRTRPNGSGDESFPSSHTSNAAVHATLASRNLESLRLPDWGRTVGPTGLGTLTAGTAWARVEARQHFPSDVLAGAALGHVLAAFFNDAFLGLERPTDVVLTAEPARDGLLVGVHWVFRGDWRQAATGLSVLPRDAGLPEDRPAVGAFAHASFM